MRWRILSLMMLVVALAHFNRISMAVAGAEQLIRKDFLSDKEMGVVYSAYLLLYTLFMMPGGWFIDRFGPKAAWMVLGFGSAVFVALTGVAGLVWATPGAVFVGLLLVRALLGVASAPLHPTGARLVGNWFPLAEVNRANGLITGSACIGIACTYVVFGSLIDRYGWPGAFLVSAGATLLIAVAWTLAGADGPRRAPVMETPEVRKLPRFVDLLYHKSLLCLTVSYAAVGYFQYLFFYWVQYYFETIRELPRETSRQYTTILTLAMGVGMAAGGLLTDRARALFGPRRGLAVVPVLGLLASAIAVIVGLVVPNPAVIAVCFAVAMAAVGASEASFWTGAVEMGGRRGGSAAAVLNTGGNAGGLLAPVLTPLISELFGWQAGLGMACVVSLIAAALWWGVDPAARLDEPVPEEKVLLPEVNILPGQRSEKT
jgi:MFS family permease